MTAKPPTAVVLGHRMSIKYMPSDDMEGNLGRVMAAQQWIQIANEQGDDSQRDTLFHELMHTVDTLTSEPSSRLTESQICRLSSGLLATLRDPRNRAVAKWLME